ncbi:hypothetical protein HDU97_008809 [Phlyctochytrium planicorne]|nr:hypothetical protein HDU97_008809 [Phlyctochytrium planicorne]
MDEAARAGYFDVVRNLHEVIEVPLTSKTLAKATRSGNLEMVKYLHGLNSEYQTSDDPWLGNHQTFPDLEDLILTTKPKYIKGALVKAAGDGALDRLVELFANGHISVLKYLVETFDADIDGFILSEAVEKGDFKMLKYLKERHPNPPGSGPFGAACRKGCLDIVKHIHETHPKSCKNTKPRRFDPLSFYATTKAGKRVKMTI